MTKILFLGHSLVARRQWSFVKKLSEKAEVICVPPMTWADLQYHGPLGENWIPVEYVNTRAGIFYYTFEYLEDMIDRHDPDWVGGYIEPYSFAARQIQELAEGARGRFKTFFHAYENLSNNFHRLPSILKNNLPIIGEADQIICGNQASLNFMKHYGAHKPIKIPHTGVETELFTMVNPEISSDGFKKCVFVGRKVGEKNYKLVEEMMNLDNRIKIMRPTEYVPDERMDEIYKSGMVLLHTSIRIPTWKEQLGYVIAEALSCGLAVVHSVEGDNMEWFGNVHGTHLANPQDPVDYLNKMDRALYDYPNHQGRKWIEDNFSNDVIADKWLEVLT